MKVGYSKTYPITNSHNILNGTWEKIWIEDEITGTEEDARKMLYSLKKQVENFHYESNKAAEKEMVVEEATKVIPEEKVTPEEKMIWEISTVTDLKVLSTYKFLAKNYPKIQSAYEQRLKQLTA